MLWSASVDQGLRLPVVADLQAGHRTRRPCAQRRDRRACRVMPTAHPHRDRRQRRGDRAGNPVPQGLHRVQRRAVRRPAGALLRQGRAARPHPAAAHRSMPTGSLPRPAPTSATAAPAPIYAEGPDYVQMPPFETFRDAESYAATLAHELTHWTRHDKRLARDFGRKRWGDEGYAKEELVAELGAAFLCADLGITPEVRDDHAAYIASWLTALQGRQAADFHRRRPCAARRRLPPRAAAVRREPGRRLRRPRPSPIKKPMGAYHAHPAASSTSRASAICGAIS